MNMFVLYLFFLKFLSVLSYDYYIFSQELPATICKTKDCQKSMELNMKPTYLNIHGLWPETNSSSIKPWYCLQNDYDESRLSQDLLAELDKYWVGLYTDAFWFRSHEWGKHGTCWNDTNQTADYYTQMNGFFRKAIDLKKELKLDEIIFNGQQEQFFGFGRLQIKIQQAFGVKNFFIECETLNETQYLSSISICLALNYKPMNCHEMLIKCDQNKEIIIQDWAPSNPE